MCELKKCSKCGLELPLDNFHKNKIKKDGLHYYCKKCRQPIAKRYYQDNKEKCDSKTIEWNLNNPEKYKKIQQRSANKKIKYLSDTYIKTTLVSHSKELTFKDIPPELVELQREHIKLIRKTREINKQINN